MSRHSNNVTACTDTHTDPQTHRHSQTQTHRPYENITFPNTHVTVTMNA